MDLFAKPEIVRELNIYYLKKESKKVMETEEEFSSQSTSTTFETKESTVSSVSEMSHDNIYKRDEIITAFSLLCTWEPWIFLVVMSIAFVVTIQTFWATFGYDYSPRWITIGLIISNSIHIIDLMSIISNSIIFSKFIIKQGLGSVNRAKTIVDSIIIVPIFLDNFFGEMVAITVRKFLLIFIIIRCYRVFDYLRLLSQKPGLNMMCSMIKKIMIVYMFVIHPLSCWWYSLVAENSINWSTNFEPFSSKAIEPKSSSDWYLVSTYYVHSTITKLCMGDIAPMNFDEQLCTIVIIWLAVVIIQGLFLSEWQSVQTENQRRQVEIYLKIKLIKKDLSKGKRIPSEIEKKIISYYILDWRLQSSIKDIRFFKVLPKTMVQNILLDKYWMTLRYSYIFEDLADALRRDIASRMRTLIFQPNDIIFARGELLNTIYFVIKGTIQLLSAVNNTTTILTLGAGTVLNEISMVVTSNSTVQCQAYTVCVIHRLRKSDLWHTVLKYKTLEQSKFIHKRITKKIIHAKSVIHYGRMNVQSKSVPILKKFKRSLKVNEYRTVDEIKIIGLSSFASSINMLPIKGSHYSKSNINRRTVNMSKIAGTYVLSQISQQYSDDSPFISTVWPFILKSQSSCLLCWEVIICCYAFLEGMLIPYYATIVREQTRFILTVYYIGTLLYVIDILIQVCTNIDERQTDIINRDASTNAKDNLETIKRILYKRLKTFTFILDLVTIFPLETVMYTVYLDMNKHMETLVKATRLVKFNRIFKLFKRLEYNFDINFVIIRLIKYVFILLISVYWAGMLYYLSACYHGKCRENSWITAQRKSIDSAEALEIVSQIIYTSLSITAGVGFGDNSAQNFHEMFALHLYFFVGLLLFTYLVSDYSSILVLTNNSRTQYQEIISVLSKFFYINKTPARLSRRIFSYLSLQWNVQEGYSILSDNILLVDAPKRLFEAAQSARCLSYFKACPLFMEIDDLILTQLVKRATIECICPNEIIVKAGDITKLCYFIDEGYAEVKSVITGRIVDIVGPGSNIGPFEMLAEQSVVCNVRSLTYIRMYVLSTEAVHFVLMSDHTVYDLILKFIKNVKRDIAIQEIGRKAQELEITNVIEEKPYSWFKYNKKNRQSYHDYLKPFSKLGIIFKLVRFLLLSRTIIPNGRFMIYWETQRAVFAYLACIIFPSLIFMKRKFPILNYFVYVLNFVDVLDMYIRFHIGYYNDKGILVAHPLYTAKYYFSHALLIDIMGSFPFDYIIQQITIDHTDQKTYYQPIDVYFSGMRLLQMYRFVSIFHYYEDNILHSINVITLIVKYFAISSVFFNIFAVLSITIGANITLYKNGTFVIDPYPNQWIKPIENNYDFDIYEPMNILVVAWYWMVLATMTNGIGDILANGKMMLYICAFIVLGYLWFTYMLVILSLKINVNVNQTLYQEGMRQLKKFMRKALVDNDLQKEVIAHLEYVWLRDHGVYPTSIIKKCSVTLRQDYQWFFYNHVFKMVPIFSSDNTSRTFLQQLASEVKETYCLPNYIVIKCNDLVSYIYIVFKGVLAIYGPDGALVEHLGPGSLFGNLDNVKITRSMISTQAIGHLDILEIPTTKFYSLTSIYAPNVQRNLIRHFLLKNMSFLKSSYTDEACEEMLAQGKVSESRLKKLLHPNSNVSSIISIITSIASLLSGIFIFQIMAFQNHTFVNYLIIYSTDIFMIIRFVFLFWTPYYDHRSILITNTKTIRKRLRHYSQIIENFTCLFPFEIFALFTRNFQLYSTYLRINRIARVIYIYRFFNSKMNRLNVNILRVKTGAIIVYLSIIINILSCVWWMIVCPQNECETNHLKLYNTTKAPERCVYPELCAMYFLTMGINACWLGDMLPRTIAELLFMILITLIQQYLIAYFLSETVAVMQNYTRTLIEFDNNLRVLNKYMKLNKISRRLQVTVQKYSDLLWKLERGAQTPKMFELLPIILKKKIKWSAYSKHLTENYIFAACHPDFLRQLSVHLRRWSYFKDCFVVQQGDVNNTMYFIQRGTVSVIDETKMIGSDNYVYDELNECDCFGLVQGLFPLIPHEYSFRADNHVVILSLKLTDWSYLLDFFPASKVSIYERMHYVKQRLFPDANYTQPFSNPNKTN